MKTLPVVLIVGRPNVGKSSLFNRLAGKRQAVVEEREGTTRDRIEKRLEIGGKSFVLLDTGGFLPDSKDEISDLVKGEIKKAINDSDIILFVCDGNTGLLPLDMELAALIRKSGKKIFPVINKIDNDRKKENLTDFYSLGLGEPLGVSCLQNLGIKELINELTVLIPQNEEVEIERRRPIKIAIAGRPNVGKSSFLNRLIEEERVIVHDTPGTTRDAVDTYFEKEGNFYLFIDTAGIRHKRKVKKAVDVYSMMRSRQAIARCDVALLVIDGPEGVTNDDVKIFDYILAEGKGCVLIVNKWDLVKSVETSRYEKAIFRRIPQANFFPVIFASAKTSRNVHRVFNTIGAVRTNSDIYIDAETLNEFLSEIRPEEVSISRNRRVPRFFGMVQDGVFPKEFIIFVKNPNDVTGAHTSFIKNRLRERFPLAGVPVKIFYKRKPRTKNRKPETADRKPWISN